MDKIIQISSQTTETNCKRIMLTQKKYDWKDSNLALFGSDTEKTVKKDSAKTEKAWIGAGQKIGLEIWRIVQFKVIILHENIVGIISCRYCIGGAMAKRSIRTIL